MNAGQGSELIPCAALMDVNYEIILAYPQNLKFPVSL
jgi:hypothetical protein